MIHFVGAGPGAVDLITVRGQRYLKEADVSFMLDHWSIKDCWNMQRKAAKFIIVPI